MIIGIGNDLIRISRIEKTIERFGDRFIKRIFTEYGKNKCENVILETRVMLNDLQRKKPAQKPLVQDLGRVYFGMIWALSTCRLEKPTMVLTGGALKRLKEITPDGQNAQIDLTITDELPMAEALVIISSVQIQETDGG